MRTALDDEIADVVASIRERDIPEWHEMSVSTARRVEDEVFSSDDPPAVEAVRDLTIPGPGGDLPIRVYRPAVETPAPALVFYHGGGWVLGTLDSADDLCRRFARRANCIVVSVDYRLAPEAPFPAAADDAYAALEWVAEDGTSTVGAVPDRLAVAGTSAGGNLAAATALRARDEGGPSITQQVLCYPMTGRGFDGSGENGVADDDERDADDGVEDGNSDGGERNADDAVEAANADGAAKDADADDAAKDPDADDAGEDPLDSYDQNADGPLLTTRDVSWFWEQYLSESDDAANPYAVPRRADDLSGLPPATVVTCGHDPLRDEGVTYASDLSEAGVPVEHLHYPGVVHGFLSTVDEAAVADDAFDEVAAAVRSRF
jgi:acetyl esterase/lipase